MAISKPKKASQTPEGVEALKSDVASFISSLGIAPPPVVAGGGAATSSYGFDDSDFRKSGPIKPSADFGLDFDSDADGSDEKKKNKAGEEGDKNDVKKKKSKPHPLQLDPFAKDAKVNNNNKNTSELPLMKASASSGQWYVDADELEAKVLGSDGRKKVAAVGIDELKRLVEEKAEVAERLMLQYAEDYQRSKRKNGDMRLLEVTARSGTSADKVSAFTCLVEDNPIANMRSLDALLSMVTSKVGKRYAFTGFEALRELFLQRLLPDHKLKSLFQRPLDILPETKDGYSLLLFWHWEQCLKQRYEKFVIALEEALKDMLPNLKDKAMKTVFLLLKSKPEQERRLLSALVNKLGDPERKAASSAMYNLSCLLSAHPNMKAMVIDEVDTFLFRPNIGMRAKYVAVNFLSQILLSKKGDGPKVAKRLIDVYFALFRVLISEYEGGKVNKHEKKNGAHGRGKRKEDETRKTMSDKNGVPLEANVEMDSRVLSALLTGINRAFPFVASDEADTVIEVQTPMLFRLVHAKNFNVGVQALMLLYQISSKNQIASDRFYRALYAKLLDATALSSSKPELFLGLLVKAMKNDLNMKRVAAFSKRLLQVALQRPPQYACGCLFILSEVLKAKPPLWSIVLQSETVDDEIEHFKDIIEEDSEEIVPCDASLGSFAYTDCGKKLQGSDSKDEHTLKYPSSSINVEDDPTPHTVSLPGGYNPRHREPSYCNADRTSWWELSVLASHVHPSVATMAQTLLSGANIVYNGDPLTDLSLTAFIDKFMEKKPKANRIAEGGWYGGSQIAPARKLNPNNRLIGEEILQLDEDEVPPEDVVFHRFYLNKLNSSKVKTKKKKASEDDAEDFLANESDETDEEDIDNMLGSAPIPLEEGEGEYDYDDLDRIADEDDDDLLGNGSDAETGPPSSSRGKDGNAGVEAADEYEDGSLEMWDSNPEEGGHDFDDAISSDAGNDSEDEPIKSKPKKRKLDGRSRASPFASLEDYEHLLGEAAGTKKSKPGKDSKRKKKKSN